MEVIAPLLAVYVVYVWVSWLRRGMEPASVVAAAAISGIVLWDAWEGWRLAGTPDLRVAATAAGFVMMAVLSLLLRKPRKPIVTLLMVWIGLTIFAASNRLTGRGVPALSLMRDYPAIPILLALKIAAFGNLFYVHQRRRDLLEAPGPEASKVFD